VVALVAEPLDELEVPAEEEGTGKHRRIRWWRGIVLFAVGAYFIIPFYAALRFSLEGSNGKFTLSAFTSIPSQPGFGAAFALSVRLAVITTVITMVLMVPTAVYVHLRVPRLRRLFDGITVLRSSSRRSSSSSVSCRWHRPC